VVVPDGDLDTTALIAWSKEQLAAYKYPRKVFIAEAFPLGPSGKVLKRELVQIYKEQI
ncbi:MAG: AMP-dependent synthetase, partial [Frankiales bacterium]|nr:AMP-dependent synthetase [Frankiales bacterium]